MLCNARAVRVTEHPCVSKRDICIEGSAQPAWPAIALEHHGVETARGRGAHAHQEMARGQHDAPLLGRHDAGGRAPVSPRGAAAHLDEHQRAIALPHNQVDLAATAARRAEIARHQREPGAPQQNQRGVLGLPASRARARGRAFFKAPHVTLPSFDLLTAARQAAGAQHYPQGALYMLATPIGNRADIGLRALHVLDLVDAVACEDTRHTAQLLQGYGLHKPLIAAHEHNEREAAQTVLARLRQGQRVAYVSDAGTPGVSDPGARLVAEVLAAGLPCVPVPGASSVTALLSVGGMAEDDGRFVFLGFLPAKGAERERAVQAMADTPQACVLLESPHRIEALARELAARMPQRRITVGRELTKQFEEVALLDAAALPDWLSHNENRRRGEFALLVHARVAHAATDDSGGEPDAAALRVLELLLPELPLKTAVKLAAQISGAPRNALYEAALARKTGD